MILLVSLIILASFSFLVCLILLARTGILTVALLAGDIGQSGLVPGREILMDTMKRLNMIRLEYLRLRAKRGGPLPTRYGDFTPLGRPAGGGGGVSGKVFRKSLPKGVGINIIA